MCAGTSDSRAESFYPAMVKQVAGTFTLEEAMLRLAAIERRLAAVEVELAELRGDPVDLREVGHVAEHA